MFDQRVFYAHVRQSPFGGHLDQGQVDGIEALLSKGLAEDLDLRWVAYVLGTAFHETARTMEPIEEYGRGAGRPYGVPDPRTGKTYFGRGFVQLTW
jgi:putative chitinase